MEKKKRIKEEFLEKKVQSLYSICSAYKRLSKEEEEKKRVRVVLEDVIYEAFVTDVFGPENVKIFEKAPRISRSMKEQNVEVNSFPLGLKDWNYPSETLGGLDLVEDLTYHGIYESKGSYSETPQHIYLRFNSFNICRDDRNLPAYMGKSDTTFRGRFALGKEMFSEETLLKIQEAFLRFARQTYIANNICKPLGGSDKFLWDYLGPGYTWGDLLKYDENLFYESLDHVYVPLDQILIEDDDIEKPDLENLKITEGGSINDQRIEVALIALSGEMKK